MILVTGGTGLVGSHLLLSLLKDGKNVRALHRKNSDLASVKKVFSYYVPWEEAEFLFKNIHWMEADITDIPALTEAFQDIKQVYHSAAFISFDPSDEKSLRKINIEGTANIVNLCISNKIEKLCYFSSIATMDKGIAEKMISENFTWHQERNHSDYAISKHGAEIEVWRGSQEGLPVIILNPGVIIGPGFWKSGSGEIFSRIAKGLKYKFPKVTGFVSVQDVVKAAIISMESHIFNQQYILVSENLSFEKVFSLVAESIGKKIPSKDLKPWMVKVGWFYQLVSGLFFGKKRNLTRSSSISLFEKTYFSNAKIKEEFSFQFTPIKEVIQETGRIFKKEQDII